MDINIGPTLRRKQQEWVELLDIKDIEYYEPPPCTLSRENKYIVASLYFSDGAQGRSVFYPRSPVEVKCYQITRSQPSLLFYSLVCFIHMSLPFFERPSCPWTSEINNEVDYNSSESDGNYFNRDTITALQFSCLSVYMAELAIRLNIYGGVGSKLYQDKWVLLRLVCCIFLILDGALSFMEVRFGLCLVPIIYISRRKSLHQIVEGMFLAAYKCIPVFTLLFILIMLWSFVGLLVFRNVDMSAGSKFDTPWESFLTCLQAYAARSFVPFVLTPYFEVNSMASFFFVSLTAITDILCTALIIAIGNRQYRIYATTVFNKHLRNRKQAIISLHRILLSDASNGARDRSHVRVSRSAWLGLCRRVRGPSSDRLAHMMFNTECDPDSDDVSCAGLFRLCALLDSRFTVNVEAENDDSIVGTVEVRACNTDSTGGEWPIRSLVNATLMWEYLLGGWKWPFGKRTNDKVDEEKERNCSHTMNPLEPQPVQRAISTESTRSTDSGSVNDGKRMGHKRKRGSLLQTNMIKQQVLDSQVRRSMVEGGWDREGNIRRFLRACGTYIQLASSEVVSYALSVPYLSPLRLCVFDICVVLSRVLLVIQLVHYSDPDAHFVWTSLGWALETFFWVEMLLLVFASGWATYLRTHGYGITVAVNISSLGIMASLGSDLTAEKSRSVLYVFLIIIQCFRLTGGVGQIKGAALFNSLTPLIARVVFIIFCVIYFFGVFAFNRFCNALKVENAVDNDDFTAGWEPYHELLNFHTFGHSLLTLFELSVLGTWSSTMNVAKKVDAVSALLFFYTYRLMMCLVVYPILNAFIIQAFISRHDRVASNETKKEDMWQPDVEEGTLKRDNRDVELSVVDRWGRKWGKSDTDISVDDIEEQMEDISRPRCSSADSPFRSVSSSYSKTSNSLTARKRVSVAMDTHQIATDTMISFWSPSGTERHKETQDSGMDRQSIAELKVRLEYLERRHRSDVARIAALESVRKSEPQVSSVSSLFESADHDHIVDDD